MFYTKKTKTPQVKSLSLEITDFSKGLNFNVEENILDPNYSVNFYNFSFKKGVLTEGYGFNVLTCPNYVNSETMEIFLNPSMETPEFVSVWFYKMYDEEQNGRIDKLLYYTEDKRLCFSRVMTEVPVISNCITITLPEKPTFTYNYKKDGYDYNLIGSENVGVKRYDGYIEPVLLGGIPNISSMCEDKGKLFCTVYGERNCIYYHVGNDVETWSPEEDDLNGKIELNDNRGKINKVISFLGYVFLIRDYGITKITNYENKLKFDIVNLSLSGNKIYENTAVLSGDKMLMLTKDGIAEFNGVSSKILDLGFNDLLIGVNNDEAKAVFHSGKYYLACKMNFNDNNLVGCEALETTCKNNALIILDVENLSYDIIRGVDVSDMASVQLNKMDKITLVLNSLYRTLPLELNKNGKLLSTPFKKEWNSPLTDLGYSNKIKLIKDISLLSLYDAVITIFTEKESKTFKVKGTKTLNKFKVNLKGKQVGVKIESEAEKAYISNLKFNIDLLDYEFTKF